MRSQLFGFVVQSHLIYELLLDCSLEQAVSLMNQHLVERGAILPARPATCSKLIHYLHDPLTIAFEAFLNEWPEEIVQTVPAVLSQHNQDNEWLRMEALKRALAWLWPNLRETTVLGNFVFAVTIDNRTLLTVTLGWNEGANPQDVALTNSFIPLYIRKLEKMGFHFEVVSFPKPPDEAAGHLRTPQPRMETLRKLKELVAYRAKHLRPNFVGIDKMQACADMHLALKTVKKYAPILYERWYDPNYEGDVH